MVFSFSFWFQFIQRIEQLSLFLADEDVQEVSKQICSKGTYKFVLPVFLRGIDRLAASELETFSYLNLPQASISEKSDLNWPRRLRNHCNYMLKNLQGRDMYEMWLKTSVGAGRVSQNLKISETQPEPKNRGISG